MACPRHPLSRNLVALPLDTAQRGEMFRPTGSGAAHRNGIPLRRCPRELNPVTPASSQTPILGTKRGKGNHFVEIRPIRPPPQPIPLFDAGTGNWVSRDTEQKQPVENLSLSLESDRFFQMRPKKDRLPGVAREPGSDWELCRAQKARRRATAMMREPVPPAPLLPTPARHCACPNRALLRLPWTQSKFG